ncbi:MAG: multiple sugar transport system substrate-binding protein [Kosmotoga sp.]|nr:multiple sugar transport system substrate-binding protein [Kosmotoga sp.]
MKKLLLVITMVLALSIFAMAEKIEVEFWHAMGGGHGKALEEIVNLFNETHPDIEVKAIYVGNYGALSQKLLASAESGNLPVLSQAYGNWTAKLIPRGVVQELDSFIKNPDYGLTEEQWDAIWAPFKKMITWGDTVYALPFNKSTYVLYYNTDAFEAYGLRPPETVEDLFFDAMMLTEDKDGDGEIDQFGFGFRTTIDHFVVFLRANNGKIIDVKDDGSIEITINSPEAKEALQFMYDMVHTYKIAYTQGGYLDGVFGDGKIMMFIETIASKPYVERASTGKHGWAWAPVPLWKTQAPPFAGTDLIMFSTASEEQKKAAWEFMKFLISPEIQAYWSVKTGYMPAVKTALETAQWKEYVKQHPEAMVPINQIPKGTTDPNIAEWYEVRKVIGQMVGDVMNNKRTIDEGLAWAEAELHRLIFGE